MSTRTRTGDAIAIPGDYQARALRSPRAAQRFWHQAKLRAIDRLAPAGAGLRLADVGCGSGVVADHLAQAGATVVGFDSNPAAIDFATGAYGSERVRFVLGPFDRILSEGPFDGLYCLEVLEHLYAEQAVATLSLLARAARPGATLFVTTPNARSAWPLVEWTLDRLRIVPPLGGVQHVTAFTHRTLAAACAQAAWQVVEAGTFNGVAPFLAPVSERLARAVERGEFRTRRHLPWNLLYVVARKP